ncbi:sulfatase family protein [Sunxiuqinia sp. A32]|uniref:sulfatase family protein n=1 Tax=Sunxiuqinia sp. A32 TaxID=3461496 RepID=UPI0040458294
MRAMNIFILLVLSMLFYSCQNNKHEIPPSPNVILILADDMGYGDLSSYGSTGYYTPNLDLLANGGMRFTNFYVAQPVCSASRAALMTGCYSNRIGIKYALGPNSKVGLNPEEETIAEVLKKSNYKTMAIGKWHLGDNQKFLPQQQGFDDYLGLPYSNDMWPVDYDGNLNENSIYPELPLIKGSKPVRIIRNLDDQAELTALYTKVAVDFIDQNKDNPFFLYLAHSMPHVPIAASKNFRGKSGQGLYGDVIMEIDWSVGEVVKALEKNGIRENTLIIFTSDNGPWLSYGDHAGSTAGLREGKLTSFEGGMRVPCIMNWPKEIPHGKVCNKLACTIDILPTVAQITNSMLPEKQIDGVDISSLLDGNQNINPRKYLYYYFADNQLEAIRMDHWKLVLPHEYLSYENVVSGKDGHPGEYNNKSTEMKLFDLRNDPGERYDVINLYPNIVKKMNQIAVGARNDLGDSLTGYKGMNRREAGYVD